MFIDASAIVAILAREPGHEEIEKRMADDRGPFFVSPLVRFEAVVALARQKAGPARKASARLLEQAEAAVAAFIADIEAREIDVTPEIGLLARRACADWGKAVGSPADLNFGDCFAYAAARHLGTRLLYKGEDFALTDLA